MTRRHARRWRPRLSIGWTWGSGPWAQVSRRGCHGGFWHRWYLRRKNKP